MGRVVAAARVRLWWVLVCTVASGCTDTAAPRPGGEGPTIALTTLHGPVQAEYERTITAVSADSVSPPVGRTRILLRNRTDTAIARVRFRLDTTNGVFVVSRFLYGTRRVLGPERVAGPIAPRGVIVLDSLPYPYPTYGLQPPHPGLGIDVRVLQVEGTDGRRLGLAHAGRHAATLRGTSGMGPGGITVTMYALDRTVLWVDQTGTVFDDGTIEGRWPADSLPVLTVPAPDRRCLGNTLFIGRAVARRDSTSLRISGDRFGAYISCVTFSPQGTDTLVLVPVP